MHSEVVDYYSGYDEENRLGGTYSIEFLRSRDIILRNLKKQSSDILDAGGAAGRYSFWLAGLGHSVTLLDMTPKHIQQAQRTNETSAHKLAGITLGNACALPYGDETFDVVLLMGPLYHILDREQRVLAIREAYRVLRRGGILFMAFISRFASMLDGFKFGLVLDGSFRRILDGDLENGAHINNTDNPKYFTTAYLHHPDEIDDELQSAGTALHKLYAVEGIANCIIDINERVNDAVYRNYLLEKIRETEEDRSIIGMSSHFMATAIK